MTITTPYAFVVRLEAKPDKGDDLAELLTSIRPLAEAETGTVNWFAVRTSDTTFFIFDTFPSEADRQDHLTGEIADALTERGPGVLAARPEILPADVLVAKGQ